MLPRPPDNGARLAAILPTGLASLASGLGSDPAELLHAAGSMPGAAPSTLPAVRSLVLIVVDGLGYSNLRARSGHAPVLRTLPTRRIETVIPSTTGAALTTITTGRLPGAHGLIGYKIRHPRLGLITTLKDWQGIEDRREWQRAEPLFRLASGLGAGAAVIGRPAHAVGGLTEAILSGAEYHGGQTIAERFSIASRLLRGGDPMLVYLYVDELDRAAHKSGWQSDAWQRRLEQFDVALGDLLRTLPRDTGVMITADHGMLDIEPARRIHLDDGAIGLEAIAEIGGEPRMRSLYLKAGTEPQDVAHEVSRQLGGLAWVGTRTEAIDAGWFGTVSPGVEHRLGEVLVAARSNVAFTLTSDSTEALAMVGQHGGLSDEERGVPLALGGALAGSSFVSALNEVAQHI